MKTIFFFIAILLGSIGCKKKEENRAEVLSIQNTYTTLNSVDLYTGKGKAGEVLMPSVSRELKSSDREKILRGIMKSEGWVIISAYSTKEAYKEKSCATYSNRSKAFKEGFLGKVDKNGKFYE
jgi:hypothetical protein